MDYRSKFLNTMLFKDTRQVPLHEVALWEQTMVRWKQEGAPDSAFATNGWFMRGDEFFGFEPRYFIQIHGNRPMPAFESKVISEDERIVTFVDENGVTHEALKQGEVNGMRMSMDRLLDFPVTDRASFRALTKRFTADTALRYPQNWDDLLKLYKTRDCPLCLGENGDFGFYSILRSFMGTEGVSYILYDDPDLVHEMLDFFCDYMIELTHKALHEVDVDYFNIWEDMTFKNGPLVSPELFRVFFLPRYKRLIAHLKDHGVKLITLDTDGDPRLLIPLYLEAGVNGIWPIEVAAGVDPISLRKEYGDSLALSGGIDKRVLARDKQAIDYELKRILDYMLPRGGYIPTVDHAVPPDVPYENFTYYLYLKRELLDQLGGTAIEKII